MMEQSQESTSIGISFSYLQIAPILKQKYKGSSKNVFFLVFIKSFFSFLIDGPLLQRLSTKFHPPKDIIHLKLFLTTREVPIDSVRPKPGFGIGNWNQDQVSVSVSWPELFLPKPKLSPILKIYQKIISVMTWKIKNSI